MTTHEQQIVNRRWAIIAAMLLGLLLISFLIPDHESRVRQEMNQHKQQEQELLKIQPLPTQEPYGGCDEAYLYPDSPGYADCQALGLVP
jgi:hypothetical protein